MKHLVTLLGLCLVFGVSTLAAETTWTNVPVIDVMCQTTDVAKADAHTRDCAVKCEGSGYGIIADGRFLKLDEAGNDKVAAALKASENSDHLRVTVTGELDGDTVKVASLQLAN